MTVQLRGRSARTLSGLALAAGLAAFGTAAAAQDATLRVGTVLPDGNPVVEGFNKFAELVDESTDGGVEIKVYPNSQLGGTQDVMDQALAGANVAAFTDAGRLAEYTPIFAAIGAPFVFESYEEADTFVTSEAFAGWAEQLREDSGYVILSFNWYQGPRYLVTKKPIESRADMDGVRIRTPGAPAWIAAARSLGGTPTPLDWAEVYSALQLGSIDAAEAGPAAVESMKFNEVASHYTKTGHIQLITGLVVGEDWWETLTEEQQTAVRESAVEAGRHMSQLNIEADEKALEWLANNGMTVSEIDIAEFVEAAKGEYEGLGISEAYKTVRETVEAE
ncbi:C4-dicarboxylate ABC transporter substrate-binding protein [Oceanicola sp. D3]|uniref:C4-dicarboxylate TRAP transporter substrate-binding protein n=1 Tax=Oceanicola sp. D3 TaxID=2587163 RepID=UPI001120C24F|nr:C4-dicarboxylate TRAP transporter substrate-binding protein [Oceanicola sp. D3]QDC10800.1 C4-dicarboxylate ABC transporter substrate-binding protein [Oceanicola sp. D3]